MSKDVTWDHVVKKSWNNLADSWDARSIKMWDHGSRKNIIRFMEKHLSKQDRVIDIGCGSGYGTYKLQQAGFQATGIDLSDKMIQLAKEQFTDKDITYFQCNMKELAEREERYDGALTVNVLEWVDEPAAALRNLHDILVDGGYLCAGILGPTAGPRANSYRRLYGEEVILNTMMPWEFSQLATENGFSLVDEYGVFKKEIKSEEIAHLPRDLQQALSFMWIFMFQKTAQE